MRPPAQHDRVQSVHACPNPCMHVIESTSCQSVHFHVNWRANACTRKQTLVAVPPMIADVSHALPNTPAAIARSTRSEDVVYGTWSPLYTLREARAPGPRAPGPRAPEPRDQSTPSCSQHGARLPVTPSPCVPHKRPHKLPRTEVARLCPPLRSAVVLPWDQSVTFNCQLFYLLEAPGCPPLNDVPVCLYHQCVNGWGCAPHVPYPRLHGRAHTTCHEPSPFVRWVLRCSNKHTFCKSYLVKSVTGVIQQTHCSVVDPARDPPCSSTSPT
jgi:hypothetical protein